MAWTCSGASPALWVSTVNSVGFLIVCPDGSRPGPYALTCRPTVDRLSTADRSLAYLVRIEIARRFNPGHERRVRDVFIVAENVHGILAGNRRPIAHVGRAIAVIVTFDACLRRSFDREACERRTESELGELHRAASKLKCSPCIPAQPREGDTSTNDLLISANPAMVSTIRVSESNERNVMKVHT